VLFFQQEIEPAATACWKVSMKMVLYRRHDVPDLSGAGPGKKGLTKKGRQLLPEAATHGVLQWQG
jgi:hypothetical protein